MTRIHPTQPARLARAEATPRGGRWLHLCNGLDPQRDGGMVPSILGFAAALARQEPGLTIATPTPSTVAREEVPPGVVLNSPTADVARMVRQARVVHMHGLWQAQTRRGAAAARRYRVPYVIAAHGMADPWAMRQKAWKKRIYTALVEGKNLRHAACLHALTRPEAAAFRELAPGTPVCLVPNGVDLRPFDELPARETLESPHPELRGRFVLLFYGRLHVKKGLDLLAEALGRLAAAHPEIHLVLAGNEDGAGGPFLRRLDELGLATRVTAVGHVAGARAQAVWARADAFVLPSYSEGFSMAILEALACRLPCVFTRTCHFPEAEQAGAAVVVEPTIDGVTAGLDRLLAMRSEERRALGEKGRALVERDYTWDRQASRLAEVYRWLETGGPTPEAVAAAEAHADGVAVDTEIPR
jgi:glycosyltransferase involved in cell wall biosynthesis